MVNKHPFKNLNLFLILGVILVVVSALVFPLKVWVQAEPYDYDDYGVGWLFTPIIGVWGLFSLVLGLVQSPIKKETVLLLLIPILIIVFISLGFAGWMAINYGFVGKNIYLFWWIYLTLNLVPTIVIAITSLFYKSKKDKLDVVMKNLLVRILAFSLLILIPIAYTIFTYLWILGKI